MNRRPDPFEPAEPLIRRVYSYVAYRIGDGPHAEDVTSETLLRALRRRETYDPSRGTPIAWLLGIARRAIADHVEERNAVPFAAGAEPVAVAPADLEDQALRRLILRRALGRLPQRDRELVALRYGADLTAREIGEVLDLRTNAVEVALHRALRRLRYELDDREDVPRVPVRAGLGTAGT